MEFPFQYTLFVVCAPLTALISLGMAAYARRTSPSPETSTLTWLIGAIAGWLVFNTVEVVDPTENGTVFWSKVSYGFIAFSPVLWLAFALQYTGQRKWLARSRFWVFGSIPLLTTFLGWTNDWHFLLWTEYRFAPVNGMLALNVGHGPWFWVHAVWSYSLVFLGAALIVRQYFKSFTLYRQQSLWMVLGAITPVLVNAVYIFRLIPPLKKDYTPLSFALASLAFLVGIFRYRLFDLKPVAREAVIDSMTDAMLVIDRQDRIIDLNPAAQSLLCLPAGKVIGQTAAEVFHPWQDLVERIRDKLEGRAEIVLERNAACQYYDLRVSPLADQRGQAAGRLIVLRDITGRKEAEAALRQYTRELEARNEELDAFAHTVAHDLKNPLAALLGYAEALHAHLPQLTAEEIDEVLQTLVRNGRKMRNIIDELLLLSQVREIKKISSAPFDTGLIIAGVLERLAALTAQYQPQIVIPERWPRALGYAPWVEEVWTNYLSNAMKYGGQPPRIELGAERLNAAGSQRSMIRFWVRDNGPGIPLEQQAALFQLFSRLEATRAEGYGLGLSIVQRIVAKLGGEVGVESRPGEGSCFWFTLPAE